MHARSPTILGNKQPSLYNRHQQRKEQVSLKYCQPLCAKTDNFVPINKNALFYLARGQPMLLPPLYRASN